MSHLGGILVLVTFVCGYLLYANVPWLDNKKYERHIFYFRIVAVGVVWQGVWYALVLWATASDSGRAFWGGALSAAHPLYKFSDLAYLFSSVVLPLAAQMVFRVRAALNADDIPARRLQF